MLTDVHYLLVYYQVSDFQKAVNVTSSNLPDSVLIIWEWKTRGHETASCSSETEMDCKRSMYESDVEADQPPQGHHTLVFKVIGCTKEGIYQSLLVWARKRLEEGHPVVVHLKPKPSNRYDPNAVAFCCSRDGKLERLCQRGMSRSFETW